MAVPTNILTYGGQMLDGAAVLDARSVDRTANAFTRENVENFTLQGTMAGTVIQTYRLGSWNGRRGPSWWHQHRWSTNTYYCDSTAFRNIQQRVGRSVRHNFCDRLEDVEAFDGDGTSLTFDLFRQALGNTYTRTAGAGVNQGTAAEQIEVVNVTTGSAYTVVYDVPPAAGQVRIDTSGANKFRRLTFEAAPADAAANIQVTYYALYNVSVHILSFPFPHDREGAFTTAFQLALVELGEAA